MVLVVEDEITLSTRFGSSQIQLMLGDITDLPVEEKVDIVFTSAFPGDYSCVKGTLIHALFKNLGISVRELARNKELDLTRVFSCWLSKPLPSDKPYGRLVCFEVSTNQTLAEQISMMFRATMPIFNGNESTVITPPLATGCQGVPVDQMVGVMVNTACHWIKAGLPLKCLKLVLFTRDLDNARQYMHAGPINLFRNLKNKWHSKESKLAVSKSFDVTFSYHLEDKGRVAEIGETMKGQDKALTLHQDGLQMKEDQSWQDEVFDTMINSTRIIVALTPSFVSDKWCVEQFSLAMCCNRFKGVEVVSPFYLQTVDSFPSYMNLIQYHDCRDSTNGMSGQKILSACKDVIQAVQAHKALSISQSKTTEAMEKKPVPVYDVFISYCHRTSEIAHFAVDILSKKYPDIKVFFDRSELKTGNIWQQALFEAVDQTRCLVAMLSDDYIKSTVCQEEYNISLARLVSQDDFLLVPVCVPQLSVCPKSYTKTKAVSISTREEVEQLIEKIMPSVLKLKGLEGRQERTTRQIEDVLERQRYLNFSKNYEFSWEKKAIQRLDAKNMEEDFSNLEARVSFSYTSDGIKFAAVLTEMLQEHGPKITCNLLSFNPVEARREIDNADMIVLCVSNEFLQSQHHVEELNIALCRQRVIKDSTVIYLVEVSPISEGFYYPSLLPFRVGLNDVMWERFSKAFEFKRKRFDVHASGMEGTYMCAPTEYVAMQMMTLDILKLLSQRGQGSEIPTNLVNVVRLKEVNMDKEDIDVTPEDVAVSISSYVVPKVHWDDDESVSGSDDEQVCENSTANKEELPQSVDKAQGQNTTSPATANTDTTGHVINNVENGVKKGEGVEEAQGEDQENTGLVRLAQKQKEDRELVERYMERFDSDDDDDDDGDNTGAKKWKRGRGKFDSSVFRSRDKTSGKSKSKSCHVL